MTTDAPRGKPTPTGFLPAIREVGAGIVAACLALPLCVSAGVLVYAPLGSEFASRGAQAGLMCAVIGGIVAALVRRSSFIMSFPTTPIALVQASIGASVLASIDGDVAAAIAAMPVLVVMVGLWQILFGATGLSRIIKFTPYPVVAGFVSGVGLLIAIHQVPPFFGAASFSALASDIVTWQLSRPLVPLFGAALVLAMLAIGRWAPSAPNLLIGLVGGYLIYHGLTTVDPGIDLGPIIGTAAVTGLTNWPFFDPGLLTQVLFDMGAVSLLIFGSLTLALLGTFDTFFAMRSAQHLADIPVAPRRDIIGQGVGNLAAALSGGLAISTSLSVSTANFKAGGRTRLSTLCAAIVLGAGVLLLSDVIFSLPVVLLAAILLVASFRVFDQWTVVMLRDAFSAEAREDRHRARFNLAIVLAVLLATVFGQPVIGASVGVALSCVIFITQMSRPIIGKHFDGSGARSKRVRSRRELEALQGAAAEIALLELQGVLFFGNADNLSIELRRVADTATIIILDMRRVADIDASGVTALQHLAAKLRSEGKVLVACRAGAKYARVTEAALGAEPGLFPARDQALEWAEERVLSRLTGDRAANEVALQDCDLAQRLTPAQIGVLQAHVRAEAYPQAAMLCRVGDASDQLWIVSRGSVGIRVPAGNADIRLASLGPGCSVGEMGLLDKRSRSADVFAETAVDAYVMTARDFDVILNDHPAIGQVILANIARQLAQRLRVTSEDLRLADQ